MAGGKAGGEPPPVAGAGAVGDHFPWQAGLWRPWGAISCCRCRAMGGPAPVARPQVPRPCSCACGALLAPRPRGLPCTAGMNGLSSPQAGRRGCRCRGSPPRMQPGGASACGRGPLSLTGRVTNGHNGPSWRPKLNCPESAPEASNVQLNCKVAPKLLLHSYSGGGCGELYPWILHVCVACACRWRHVHVHARGSAASAAAAARRGSQQGERVVARRAGLDRHCRPHTGLCLQGIASHHESCRPGGRASSCHPAAPYTCHHFAWPHHTPLPTRLAARLRPRPPPDPRGTSPQSSESPQGVFRSLEEILSQCQSGGSGPGSGAGSQQQQQQGRALPQALQARLAVLAPRDVLQCVCELKDVGGELYCRLDERRVSRGGRSTLGEMVREGRQ